MSDKEIVQLYFDRNDMAISETSKVYGAYLSKIAKNILGNQQDTEECVNDTYLRVWNSIPPNRPEKLSAYIGKIVRNLSLDRYKQKRAEKRGSAEIELVLDEISEIVSGGDSVEGEIERKELSVAINSFLDTLAKEKCDIFVCRYWYSMTVREISRRCGVTENNVSVVLSRTRKALKDYLLERGFEI